MPLAPMFASLLIAAVATGAPPKKPKCKKHIVVTFAVYYWLPRAEVKTNGCWTPEYTVQDGAKFNLCHDKKKPPAGRKAVSIYDDANRASHAGRDPREVAACAKHGVEFWEYLTPPYATNIIKAPNLKRIYAELYNSTSGPADFLGQWKIHQAGHTIWPMLDVSIKHPHASVARALHEVCARVPDHGVIGIYGGSDITDANKRLPLVLQALDACTGK